MPRIPVRIAAQGADAAPKGRSFPGPAMLAQQTKDRQVNALQRGVQEATRAALTSPLVDGNLVANVQFTGLVAQAIAHRLGRPWRGYLITRCTDHGIFRVETQSGDLDRSQLTLTADVSCVADVWVF